MDKEENCRLVVNFAAKHNVPLDVILSDMSDIMTIDASKIDDRLHGWLEAASQVSTVTGSSSSGHSRDGSATEVASSKSSPSKDVLADDLLLWQLEKTLADFEDTGPLVSDGLTRLQAILPASETQILPASEATREDEADEDAEYEEEDEEEEDVEGDEEVTEDSFGNLLGRPSACKTSANNRQKIKGDRTT